MNKIKTEIITRFGIEETDNMLTLTMINDYNKNIYKMQIHRTLFDYCSKTRNIKQFTIELTNELIKEQQEIETEKTKYNYI